MVAARADLITTLKSVLLEEAKKDRLAHLLALAAAAEAAPTQGANNYDLFTGALTLITEPHKIRFPSH